jgi:hypothetical protein
MIDAFRTGILSKCLNVSSKSREEGKRGKKRREIREENTHDDENGERARGRLSKQHKIKRNKNFRL